MLRTAKRKKKHIINAINYNILENDAYCEDLFYT